MNKEVIEEPIKYCANCWLLRECNQLALLLVYFQLEEYNSKLCPGPTAQPSPPGPTYWHTLDLVPN
eukprot:745887-Ditylum_brightwellii.AAC.1